jgi:hypothetical protein
MSRYQKMQADDLKGVDKRASGIADELADLHYITDETRVGSVPSTCNARLRSTDMELDVAPVHPDVSVVAVVGGSAFQTRSGRSAGYGPQQVHHGPTFCIVDDKCCPTKRFGHMSYDLRKRCKSYFNSLKCATS